MSKDSIFELFSVRTTVNEQLLKGLVSYLVHNTDSIVPANETSKLTTAHQLGASPIDSLFTKAMAAGCDRHFSFVRIRPGTTQIPEIITYDHVCFDLKQLKGYENNLYAATKGQSFHDKIVLNITQMTRASGDLIDISSFQGAIIRDLLSRTYYQADRTWLTPDLILQACRVYSMSLSADIATLYQLQYNETKAVQALFAFFFLSKCMPVEDAKNVIVIQTKALGLQDVNTVKDVLGLIVDLYGNSLDKLSILQICTLLESLGIPRLKIDYRTLLQRVRSYGETLHVSAMALEYPPYFVYLMLQAVSSGKKIGLSNRAKQLGLLSDIRNFAIALEKSHSFISAI